MSRQKWYMTGIGVLVLVAVVAAVSITLAAGGDGARAATGPLRLVDADNGKTFTVKAGETVEARVAGNLTTGYAWMAALSDEDAVLLEQQGEPVYVQDFADTDMVGTGGTYTFTFRAAAEGEATLKLVYSRPWESVGPLDTYEVTIVVE